MQPGRDKPLSFCWAAGGDWIDRLHLPPGKPKYELARIPILLDAAIEAAGQGRLVSYSRTRNFYTGMQRYHGPLYTYLNVTRAVDELASLGLIEHWKSRPNVDRGTQSRFRAAPSLIEAVTIQSASFTRREPIVFKDDLKRLVDYQDTERTRRMRKEVARFNEALSSALLTIEAGQHSGPFVRFPCGSMVNMQKNTLHRVFSGAWDRGGRFYGPWFQNVPSADRDAILIDGEATTEPDFAQLHPTLFYALAGAEPDGDAYTVGDWPRPLAKVAFNVIINATTYDSALGAVSEKIKERTGRHDRKASAALIADMKQRHQRIARWFHTGAGARMQRIDSDLAAAVMRELLGQNIVALPIHDSFRVKKQHEQAALEAMNRGMFEAKKQLHNAAF